jgi:hypothetical protein
MRFLLAISLALLATTVSASPWPVEASVAYVEELSLACAKAEPEAALNYQARRDFLFSEWPDRVEQARTMRTYPDLRKWARDTITNASPKEFVDECHSFLTDSNLALRQVDPDPSRLNLTPVK